MCRQHLLLLTILMLLSNKLSAEEYLHEEICNDLACGSIVSKCLLTKACSCNSQDVRCYKQCFHCLDRHFDQCCSCVGMCPDAHILEMDLSHSSHVEELPNGTPELFDVLTEEHDNLRRWLSFTFPAHIQYELFLKTTSLSSGSKHSPKDSKPQVNCTVAYMSKCMSWNKCRSSCLSMGASSYRWFHDGCCECVGNHCINYGINESKCLECPLIDES